jgi:acetyl-CoA carboxylase carboxyl transferase subunit alpha
MLQHSIYSVISPEGCASILYRDASKASLAAEKLKLTSQDLLRFRLIDGIIPEPLGGAHRDQKAMLETVKKEVQQFLEEQSVSNREFKPDKRTEKFLKMASYETTLNLFQSQS